MRIILSKFFILLFVASWYDHVNSINDDVNKANIISISLFTLFTSLLILSPCQHWKFWKVLPVINK